MTTITGTTGDPISMATVSGSTRIATSQFPSPLAAPTPSTAPVSESQILGTHQHRTVGITALIP
ncbi:hypothetical protein EAG_08199 [Camponotus floridanus]|uniref:Uncharacterized protein n=1 Tax=Camponotus floridanus TaxID=104421 RepID=E2A896_CAMFO|nr:hypothetical protein EAG_08199 [Camponotus floridanus]